VAEVTLPHALFAAFFAALGTANSIGGELPAVGTFLKTVQTKCFAAAVALIKARSNFAPTFATGDQAVGAEALA
jgi:hypothetical protein